MARMMAERCIELPPRPDWGVGVDDRAGSICPLPAFVLARTPGIHNGTVVWSAEGHCGVFSDGAQVSWRVSPSARLELDWMTPGRGGGNLSLALHQDGEHPVVLAFASRHTKAYQLWLTELARAISEVTGLQLLEHDYGPDA